MLAVSGLGYSSTSVPRLLANPFTHHVIQHLRNKLLLRHWHLSDRIDLPFQPRHQCNGSCDKIAGGRNSAAAGATGAVSGELMGQLIIHSMYPGKQVSDLQESDKQIISALSTLAAGLAGGVTGGGSASALAGAQAGKNAVENNSLRVQEADRKKQLETKRDYLK
ncbi:VENN motif pre-toxin domain-containing protein, partial [Priestia megaterium]|uniref:VENN motif pre-toxin domain-containing protein n=1 Tax=Priestia megaterium TaxID=1404 RepID=UPI00196B86F0